MKREVAGICMSLILGGTYIMNPMVINKLYAADSAFVSPTKEFSMGSMTAITNGTNALTASQDTIDKIKVADDFTYNATVKLTGTTAVQSIFYIGDGTVNNYIVIYLSPDKKIGIEARNGDTRSLNVSKDTDVNLRDGAVHRITFTQKKGSYYKFYIDGKIVLEGATNAAFCNGLLPDASYLGMGNGNRPGAANSYPFTGEIGNVQLFNSAISEEQIISYSNGIMNKADIAYTTGNHFLNTTSNYAPQTDVDTNTFTSMNAGSISVRFRSASASGDVMSLFSLSDSTQAGKYANLYVAPNTNKIGMEVVGGTASNGNFVIDLTNAKYGGASIKNTAWHTLTLVKSNTVLSDKSDRYTFYLDGKKLDVYSNKTGFFNGINSADSVNVGFVKRAAGEKQMKFTGAIDNVNIYNTVLSEAEAIATHTIAYTPTQIPDLTNAIKTDPISLFQAGYLGSSAYRIPSLLTTDKGTVLTAIDKRNTGAGDAGNIDEIVRRKEAGSSTFDEAIVVADLVDKNNTTPSAFLIDPAMVQDKETGRIFMLMDMFPESSGLMNIDILKDGNGYKKIDGVDYQILYTQDNKEYTIRENGVVYDDTNQKSEYRVVTECEAPYKELGNIYKAGNYVGNMYIFSGSDAGELHIARTQYLWLSYSDDDGKTWSKPKDITPQVKKDWMVFLGTGPGVGIQLKDGTLSFPVYSARRNVGGTQFSAMIHSKDGGETWTLGDSPAKVEGNDPATTDKSSSILTESQAVQLNNGQVKLFMRNYSGKVKVATSNDGGNTWDKIEQIATIPDVYCQLSVTHYNRDGKEYVALLNPAGPTRANGHVYLGEVNGGDITWTNSKLLHSGGFAYSSISAIGLDAHGDMKFGAIYEGNDSNSNIYYTEFDENFVKAGTVASVLKAPELVSKSITRTANKVSIAMTFDQTMMAAGNPSINLRVGETTFKANYVSGSASSTLKFEATLSEDMFGIVKATGIDETNGLLENINGEKASITAFDVIDLSEIKIAGVNASSQHSTSTAPNTDGAAVNVIDGNKDTYWHSKWGDASVTLPQSLTFDLGKKQSIYKLSYLPRQSSASGHVLDFDILVSDTENGEYKKIYTGSFANTYEEQSVEFAPVDAKYVRFTVNRSTAEGSTSVAEMKVFAAIDELFEGADTSKLEAEKAAAQELITKGDNYTTATKDLLKSLVDDVTSMLQGKATQNMINDAINKLKTAMDNLIDISKVKSAIATADTLKEKDYTKASWTAFQSTLKSVKDSYSTITTKRGVSDLLMKLSHATSLLEATAAADMSALQALVNESAGFKPSDYTQTSAKAYMKSILDANAMISEATANQSQVDTMASTIKTAKANLVSILDISAMIKTGESVSSTAYQEESFTALTTAISDAKKALIDGTAQQVANAITSIRNAMNALVTNENTIDSYKMNLNATIQKAQDIKTYQSLENVSEVAKALFQAQLQSAIQAYADKDATNKTLMNAWTNLTDAIANLNYTASKAQLQALLTASNAIDLTSYAKDKYMDEFNAAKTNATTAIQSGTDYTQAFNRLATAKNMLRLKAGDIDTSFLDLLITKCEETVANKEIYDTTAKSWTAFETALAQAKQAKIDLSSQDAINAAIKKLTSTYEDIRLIANEDTLKELQAFLDKLVTVDTKNYGKEDIALFANATAIVNDLIKNEFFTMKDYQDATSLIAIVNDRIERGRLDPTTPATPATPTPDDKKPIDAVKKDTTSPNTGDTTSTTILLGSMAIAGIAGVAVQKKQKSKKV